MIPRPSRLALLLGVLLVPPASARSAGEVPTDTLRSAPEAPDSLRPAVVFASIERAWVTGDAAAVVQQFGKRKAYISLPDGGPQGGHFSRDQSYFILKDFFDGTRTEEFSFVTIRAPEEDRNSAIGQAVRSFRRRNSSRMLQDRIFVSLVLEDARWVVSEIRAVR